VEYKEILDIAVEAIINLQGHVLDILDVKKPIDLQAAIDLSKVVSKLSPIVGNTIESTLARYLNTIQTWPNNCVWLRQDPDFPDIVLSGMADPRPGLEVKAWFPLATEMTARFRDSQALLQEYNTKVVVVSWMPEFVIAGKPKILDVFACDAIDFAQARDNHYHNPPEYIVIEPQDTRERTRNLQQKNCNGLRFQGSATQLQEARNFVLSWGPEGKFYKSTLEYQQKLYELMARYSYRLDTNFAKIDRIDLASLEIFKRKVLNTVYIDRTVQEWIYAINRSEAKALVKLIEPGAPLPIEPFPS
jgi:hypothetical protein